MTVLRRPARMCVVALLLLGAACGGGSSSPSTSSSSPAAGAGGSVGQGKPAAAWTHDVCSALQTWITAWESLLTNVGNPSSPAEIKTTALRIFDSILEAEDALSKSLAGVGTPDVANGAALADKLRDIQATERDSIAAAKTKMESLDPSNSAFSSDGLAALQLVQDALTTAQSDYSSELAGSSLDKAFNDDSACRSIGA